MSHAGSPKAARRFTAASSQGCGAGRSPVKAELLVAERADVVGLDLLARRSVGNALSILAANRAGQNVALTPDADPPNEVCVPMPIAACAVATAGPV